jgi:fatty-acyl-CoA synthase
MRRHPIPLVIRSRDDIAAIERIPLDQRVESWDISSSDISSWDISALIRKGCERAPERPAVLFVPDGNVDRAPQVLSFGDLRRRATRAANLFHALGVRSGHCVAFLLPNVPEVYVTAVAGLAAGIAVPINWNLDAGHIAQLLQTCRAKVIVALGPTPGYDIWEKMQAVAPTLAPDVHILSVAALGGEFLPASDLDMRADAMPDDRLTFDNLRGPDDIAAYIHSGGTTGVPKFVRITNRGLVYKAWSSRDLLGYTPEDVFFADYPFFHVAGFVNRAVVPLALGMSMVIPSAAGARDRTFIGNYWKFVERYGITQLSGVPTTLSLLAKSQPQGERLDSLRPFTTTGSQPLPVEVAKQIERIVGIRVLLTYGSTEYTTTLTQTPPDAEQRHGSTGLRLPYTQVRIVRLDADGTIERDCAVDEIGTIIAKGPGITPGYLDPEHNRGLFVDGWFVSGDLGRLDVDGYLWLTGRAKDLIIRGGHNIDPALIEEPLLRHPAVLYAAAVGRPDAYAGEIPIAYVKLADGARAGAEDLLTFVRTQIAERAAVPAEIVILEDFPLTDVRKPAKAALRFDAARRTFERLVRTLLPPRAGISVEVDADPVKGMLVTIRLTVERERRAEIEPELAQQLAAFAVATRLAWSETEPANEVAAG